MVSVAFRLTQWIEFVVCTCTECTSSQIELNKRIEVQHRRFCSHAGKVSPGDKHLFGSVQTDVTGDTKM